MQQLNDDVFDIMEGLHPDKELVFCFDNSQNHHAKSPDCLMNLSDGGAQPKLRDSTWNGQHFSMRNNEGLQKGARTILKERGCWRDGLRLECKPSCLDNIVCTDCCAKKS